MERKIKTAQIYRSNIGTFENNAQDNGYLYKKREYDKTGNMLWEIKYLRNGKQETITDYYYNEDNKTTEKKVFYPQDNTEEKTTYKYNKNGDLEEETLYYDGELFIRQKTAHNEKNLTTAIESYNSENELTDREVLEYNERDKMSRHTHYNESGEADWQIEAYYNDKDQLLKEIHHNLEEGTKETVLFTYNEAGKNIRSESIDADGNTTGYVEVTYNEQDKPTKYLSETMGYSISKIINQIAYNEAGKILESEYYDVLNGQLSGRESYEYDENGHVKTEEQFELRNQSDKKTHYRLLYNYEYFVENE
ncbi:MAG: hypothetical protein ACXWEY_14510 [Bacteroidia bacterium]